MFLTIREAGYCKNVSPVTVRQAIITGRLKGVKIPVPEPYVGVQWVVAVEDLEGWSPLWQGETDYIRGYHRSTVTPARRKEIQHLRDRWVTGEMLGARAAKAETARRKRFRSLFPKL